MFNNISFLAKSFSRTPFTEPQTGLTSSQDSRSSKGSSCSRQVWSLSLKLTWGTGAHTKLQLEGALLLCAEVFSPSGDFHAGFQCAWQWVMSCTTQPEGRGSRTSFCRCFLSSRDLTDCRRAEREASLRYDTSFTTGAPGTHAATQHPRNNQP